MLYRLEKLKEQFIIWYIEELIKHAHLNKDKYKPVIENYFNTYETDHIKFHQKTEKDKFNWYVMETVVLLLPVAHTSKNIIISILSLICSDLFNSE